MTLFVQRLLDRARQSRWSSYFHWLHHSTRHTLKRDALAGLTNAIIVLPQGVAFATIAGLPPEYGLFTAIVPAIVAGLFGSSHHLISGPTTAISIVVFSTLSALAEPGSADYISLALTLTFMVGAIQLAFGLGRLGKLVNFVSHSVVVGFTCGAAILIATSQLKHLFGFSLPSGGSFLHTWVILFEHLPDMNPHVLIVGLTALFTAIVVNRFFPRWPDLLIAIVIGSVVSEFLDPAANGIQLVGSLPRGLPPLSFPASPLPQIRELASGAMAISLLGLIEAVSIARAVALQSGQRINGNQEFAGQGLANLVGSFFSAYPSSGSFTRTGVNYRSGAITSLSAVFAGIWLIAVMNLVAPLAAHMPTAVMAGVILRVAYNLIDFQAIRGILRAGSSESTVLLVTFFSTLLIELEFAIFAGVFLSLALYLGRTANPKVVTRVPDPDSPHRAFISDSTIDECPQLKIIRIDGSLYFGSVDHVESVLHRLRLDHEDQRHLLIVGSGINFVDLAGAELMLHEARQRRRMKGHLFLFDIKEQVCGMFKRSGYIDVIGRDHVFRSKREAIHTIVNRFNDKAACERCEKKIFLECQNIGEPATEVKRRSGQCD